MSDASGANLARRAQDVLERNRCGTWTCPARGIYPHQWLWDSCFIAIGLARYDPERAAGELRRALSCAMGERHVAAHDLRGRFS